MPYLTATEAAARARVSPNTIYRRVKDGTLKEHREGTRPRYLDRDIDALFHPDKIKAPPGPCRIIAVANQKGGVGKTTTTANLSAVIAAEGYRVLAIDCDPQGSLTTVLGVDATKLEDTLYNVLIDRLALEKATKRPILALDTLSLVGGNIRLSAAERELLGALRREERLNQAISPHLAEYDFIFLDTPPNLGLLTLNALVAAHEVIIPVDMAPLAILGLDSLMDTIKETQTNYPGLARARPLFSRVERTNLSQEIESQINNQFGEDVFKSQIRSTVRAKEAQYSQQPISLFRPSDPLVADYQALAQEVIHG